MGNMNSTKMKRISHKESARWGHLHRSKKLARSALCEKNASITETRQLFAGIGAAILRAMKQN